jgi:peptide/nickel transport system substrate-binding protein
LATILTSTILPSIVFAQDEVPYGPWVDEIRFESGFDEPVLFEKLSAGDMHLYCKDWTDIDLLEQIKASSELKYQTSFGLNYDLTFNVIGPTFPATGKFNPFVNRKIRVAMNKLVDRDYVVDEIMKGLAVPKYIPIVSAFPDYGRLAETAVLIETLYKHDAEAATATITEELVGMGAEKIDGKWTYDGEVITLKVLIRTEDQRLQIGDYAADLMEELGFETERDYRTSSEAAPIWLFGDPADGEWHIYTGGWISTIISRDDADVFAGYYTDMGYSVPLWQAYENDPKFYVLADRLNSGDYSTWEERMEMMRECALLALEDSNRIFLVDQLAPFVQRQDITLAFDLSGGYSNPIWALTIKREGEVGGVVTCGSSEILVQPWNPEEGSNWLYDSIIIECIIDRFPHVYNPYTGLPMPHLCKQLQWKR